MELAKPRRVHLMDELRGVLIIGVVLYHLLYDLAVLFPVGIPWMFSDWMNSVRNICAGALIVVSGISCHYTRSNWRRGLRAFGLGMLLTVVTALFIEIFSSPCWRRCPPWRGFLEALCFFSSPGPSFPDLSACWG